MSYGPVTCDRCGRVVDPWPLKRGNRCSPDGWAMCIRNDEEIMREIGRALVTEMLTERNEVE